MNLWLFFLSAGPGLVVVSAAVVFAGLSVRRRKEAGLVVLFFGLVFQLVGLICTHLGLASLTSAQVNHQPLSEVAQLARTMSQAGRYLPLVAGSATLVGWILLSRTKQAIEGASEPKRVA